MFKLLDRGVVIAGTSAGATIQGSYLARGILSILFSKRLQQLNLPLSSLDVAKGLKSEIIKLKSKEDN